jgi:hypothetical protein
MEHQPNPYDAENKIDRTEERRDMSQAGILRRAAFRFTQRGQTSAGILLKNAAFILENPCCPVDRLDSLEYNRIPRESD